MDSSDLKIFTPPRPRPILYEQQTLFSRKKERMSGQVDLPPKLAPPRSKSSVRFLSKFSHEPRVKFISFKSNYTEPTNSFYDSSKKQLFLTQCFTFKGNLGSGSFGDVYKVESKEDKKKYAVKRTQMKYQSNSDRARKLKEVEKHENLPEHPNLVKFLMAWEERRHIYILTELCQTSLCDYAEKCHNIEEEYIWNYIIDLLLALQHLHNHDLVHMDIKPENIFISYDDVCKLGDFGLVLNINEHDDLYDASEGDPKYLAPEILQGHFGKAADIFSLGITMLELAIDLDLPKGNDLWHLLRSGQLPEHMLNEISDDLKTVIRCMMEPVADVRKSANELLQLEIVNREFTKRETNRPRNMAFDVLFNNCSKITDDHNSFDITDSDDEKNTTSSVRKIAGEKLTYSSPSSDESPKQTQSPLSKPRSVTTPRRRHHKPITYSASSSSPSIVTPAHHERNIASPLLSWSMKTDLFGSKYRRLTSTVDNVGYKETFSCTPQNLSTIFYEMDKDENSELLDLPQSSF